uniref:C-type lectin domain family 3 member A n=1 Tax=Oryzias sinensis TaxID=183150 RepID=A0A8C7X6W2_9TELE
QQYMVCTRVMAHLAVPVLLLSFSLLCCSSPSRTRKAISPIQAGAEDDDVKSQIEKLWQEVHLLKEKQALQTGKTPNIYMMENGDLRNYARRSAPGSSEFWIGVSDIVKEGQYVDVNSLPVSYFNWDRSKKQPTGTKRESCVALSVAAQGKWQDEVCRSLKKYICEFVIP